MMKTYPPHADTCNTKHIVLPPSKYCNILPHDIVAVFTLRIIYIFHKQPILQHTNNDILWGHITTKNIVYGLLGVYVMYINLHKYMKLNSHYEEKEKHEKFSLTMCKILCHFSILYSFRQKN